MLLQLLKDSYPDDNLLPFSYYDSRKLSGDIGLRCGLIHACKNDCVLFWKKYEGLDHCPKCLQSRWKINDGKGKKVPQKIVRYFPLKPRLQRLFMSRKIASYMRWHKEKRVEEIGVLSHLADGESWKEFDEKFPWFAEDARNVRLALSSDGFNPFNNMCNSYSIWPVVLINYNMPPWALMWTINDFPAYGDLSGWVTKGKMACPCCNDETDYQSLRNKIGYLGHRHFLPDNHVWRNDGKKINGKVERRLKPRELSVKYPDGYAANISRCVNIKDGKISGLKSHDCHILLQRMLPIGLRGFLSTDVYTLICEVAKFFQDLCSKKLRLEEIEKLEKNIVMILCKLEMIFPLAFFDIMIPLAIHLRSEAKLGGPVQRRWMYLFERYLRSLKGTVKNKAYPEGSIAETYIMKNLHDQGDCQVNKDLYSLAMGLDIRTTMYPGCIVNGVKFLTKERDSRRKTQNSGIRTEEEHNNEIIGFYGIVNEVMQLRYRGNYQATPVFYVKDTKLGGDWHVVLVADHRYIWDPSLFQPTDENDPEDAFGNHEAYQQNRCSEIMFEVQDYEAFSLDRADVDPETIDSEDNAPSDKAENELDDFINDDMIDEESRSTRESEEEPYLSFSSDSDIE
ncbi:uncharacterized protein [Coffea arabica]|uniref:DUF4218 domain-containing protein n=1 Tax=Coffea arabica TaxID=13443 RepID=A0ABM4X7K1_COFAR